jgi:hypothetical protein
METGLVHLHNLLRWVILICLLVAIVKSYNAWQKKQAFAASDRKLWLITMISAHITLLLGIYPSMMIIAIVLITLGRGMAKKSVPDTTKYKKAFWYFFIALVLILAAVPWPFREVGRPLFPGM